MKTTVVHWFRRDLRLDDNTALLEAISRGDEVFPIFVFDEDLLGRDDTGGPRVQFLLDNLSALSDQLQAAGARLYLRRGNVAGEIDQFCEQVGADLVCWNRDYSPYAVRRDQAVSKKLAARGVEVAICEDHLLVPPEAVVKDDGSPFVVFSPFARRWRTQPKRRPRPCPPLAPIALERLDEVASMKFPTAEDLGYPGSFPQMAAGEAAARAAMDQFLDGRVFHYKDTRDFPDVEGTSRLSPHLKYGTISPRRVFYDVENALGLDLSTIDFKKPSADLGDENRKRVRQAGTFLDEVCWREFYFSILHHFPHVSQGPFRRSFDDFVWPGDKEALLTKWTEGRTGFPIVDAGMRQLATTGWMHNRLRMICAMHLTKILLIDWREGERVFMQRLIDGDLAPNNGGWQWSASTGTDAAPYFRIFNPYLQSKKFDPDGTFIRRFVPELSDVEGTAIHEPHLNPEVLAQTGYPAPCVDYKQARERALEVLKPRTQAGPAEAPAGSA